MATTLAHTQLGEEEFQKAKNNELSESLPNILPNDVFLGDEPRKTTDVYNVLFKLVRKKKGRCYLSNTSDNVLNPKTGKRERIWLLNGAGSIWQSEIGDLLKDKSRYDRSLVGRDIVFVDGVLRVRSDDEMMIEFLRLNRDNVGKNRNGNGKFDFYEYDPQEEQKERHRKQLLKIEMVLKAKEMPMDKARMMASFLGISFVDELGMPKTDEGIRTELMLKADTNPIQFEKYIDSKEVMVSYMVKKAIIEAKIDLTGQTGNAIWANGKGFICKVPASRKPYEYLTELAMTNSDEGKAFFDQLKTVVQV